MRYQLLGRSGLRVSEFALGTMTFGEEWGWGASKQASRAMFDAFLEAGGNFIDTANRYTDGTSERLLGEFIAADRDRVVLATKYTLFERRDHPNASGNHRKNLVSSLEASLGRLRTTYVDVLWVHAWDPATPLEETMRALDDLVRAGKVLYIGISDTPAWVVSRAHTLAELRGWTAFAGLQVEYNLAARDVERELLPMARELDLAVVTWGALAGGALSGKYAADRSAAGGAARYAGDANQTRLDARHLAIAATVRELAAELGITPAQVALGWVRQQPGNIIPILGARRVEQLRDNLATLEHPLPAAALERLDAVSRIPLGFPAEFLQRPNIRDLVSGGFHDRVTDHRHPAPAPAPAPASPSGDAPPRR